jgi:hypothetical protein
MQAGPHIVPVKGDVQLAVMDRSRIDLGFQLPDDPIGKIDSPRLDAYQYGVLQVEVIFQQLMRQSLNRYSQLLFIQNGLQERMFL